VMIGDAMTSMALEYIRELESKIMILLRNRGTIYDLAQISLEKCISHPDWMVVEPAVDLHRQNKEELFEMMRKKHSKLHLD